jgi:hypothetical protein
MPPALTLGGPPAAEQRGGRLPGQRAGAVGPLHHDRVGAECTGLSYGQVLDSCISTQAAASGSIEIPWLAGRLAKRQGRVPGSARPVDMGVYVS